MNRLLLAGSVIAIGFLLTSISTTLYLPAMPQMVTVLHSTAQVVMFTLSVYFIGYTAGQLLWGTVSDSFGRRPTMLLALLLFTLSALSIIFTRNIIYFCLGYAAVGFCSAAFTSVGNAILKDLYGKRAGFAISLVGVLMSSGATLGAVIGGHLLLWFGWRAVFIFLAAVAFLLFIAIMAVVPETHQDLLNNQKVKYSFADALKTILRNKKYVSYVLSLGLVFGCFYAFLDAVPFIYTHLFELSAPEFSLLLGLATVSYIIGAAINSIGLRRGNPCHYVIGGIVICLLSTIALVVFAVMHSQNAVLMTAISFCMLFGYGMTVPAAKAGAMTSVEQYAGTAASLMKFTQSALSVVLITLASRLHNPSSMTSIAVLLLFGSIVAMFVFLLLQRKVASDNQANLS